MEHADVCPQTLLPREKKALISIMTRKTTKFMPPPRLWNKGQVLARIGHSDTWFDQHKTELEKDGFPKPDPLFKKWDADRLERWLDVRSGLAAPSATDDWGLAHRIERLGNG